MRVSLTALAISGRVPRARYINEPISVAYVSECGICKSCSPILGASIGLSSSRLTLGSSGLIRESRFPVQIFLEVNR